MSEWHPGVTELPAVPPPWLPDELVRPAPRAPMRRPREVTLPPTVRLLIVVALCALTAWMMRDVFIAWMLAPLFVGGGWGCWY